MPEMGPPRFDVRLNMQLFPTTNYPILYRATVDSAEVVSVVHGAREWEYLV